jgi:hypothetical protein
MSVVSILADRQSQDVIDISVIDKWVARYIYMLSYAKENPGRRRYPGGGSPDRNNPDFRLELCLSQSNSGGLL